MDIKCEKNKRIGWNPLQLAAKKGYKDVCLALIANGADVNN